MSARSSRSYASVRSDLLERLREQPALARLQIDERTDWIVALCDAWAALADVIGFYQQRIVEEAFLATAQQPSSVQLIYHSLGHPFALNAAATTTLAYHLTSNVAGVEAVTRAGNAGGVGTSAQERAQATWSGVGSPGAGGAPGGDGAPDIGAADGRQPSAPAGGAGAPGGAAAGSGGDADGPAGGGPGDGVPAPGVPAAGGGLLSGTAAASGLPAWSPTGRPPVGSPAGIRPAGAQPPAVPAAVGVASQIPPAAQVRAIPTSAGKPPVFVTLAPLAAYVGVSRLGADVSATSPPPALAAATTQVELAGAKTGLAVGQPVLVTATGADGTAKSWP